MKRVVTHTVVTETAKVLREEILSRTAIEPEVHLGSEDQLIERLGVSRATLRQAARLLEHEQLLHVRRGPGGGVFGRQPTGEAVGHMASVFLRAKGTTYGDLIRCQTALGTSSASLAALHGTEEGKARLVEYYDRAIGGRSTSEIQGDDFVRVAGRFQVELARLAGSVPLQLFVQILMELAIPVGARVLDDPQRMQVTIQRHTSVAQAVQRGNGALAAKRMREHLEMMLTWTDQSLRIETMPPIELSESWFD